MNDTEQRQWVVSSKEAGLRLDLYLMKRGPPLSRTRVQRLIEQGHVRVNDRRVKPSHKVQRDDRVAADIPAPVPIKIEAEAIPLDIVYEDGELLVVNKPAGMVVHPAPGNYSGTLVHALLYHCRDLGGIGGKERPGLVHRLDKDTSGILVVAKTDVAHRGLTAQFKTHQVYRRYLALVHGLPRPGRGKIEVAIGRDLRERKMFSPRTTRPRQAITNYMVLERWQGISLVAVEPQTGRTHQIRVHFSHIGHPVVGDRVYGRGTQRTLERRLLVARQMLHAETLGFRHPVSGEVLRFSAILPEDMETVIKQLRSGPL